MGLISVMSELGGGVMPQDSARSELRRLRDYAIVYLKTKRHAADEWGV